MVLLWNEDIGEMGGGDVCLTKVASGLGGYFSMCSTRAMVFYLSAKHQNASTNETWKKR